MTTWAVVVAAGRGERFGGDKLYRMLGGLTVLERSLLALEKSGAIHGIVLVHAPSDAVRATKVSQKFHLPVILTEGGDERQDSVYRGLLMLPTQVDIVAIHDGARPLADPFMIARCVESAREYGSGIAASVIRDTIKRIDTEGIVLETPARTTLRAIKTPQCFRMPDILCYYARARREGWKVTDDAQVAEKSGATVRLVPCGDDNIKITLPEDIDVAEALLGRIRVQRVGMGYDVHALVADRKLILCGVDIPHENGLQGHSDADVASHALIDALLGAAALGDIGLLFPDTDERYRGADSIVLLQKVMWRMCEVECAIVNVDITIVAQRPKLSLYRDAMRVRLAETLMLELEKVNIKMKTTERLGFTGREEGIAAYAIVMVSSFCG